MSDYSRNALSLLGRASTWSDRLTIAGLLGTLHFRSGPGRALGDRFPRKVRRVVRVGLDAGAVDLVLRRDDALVLMEMFAIDPYGMELGVGDRPTIVDLGANVGAASIRLAQRFAGARVFAVEPDRVTAGYLRRNLDANVADARTLVGAISNHNGTVYLESGDVSAVNQVVPQDRSTARGTQVPAFTLETVLDHFGLEWVDLLKVDIEGGERDLLATAANWAGRVNEVVGEVHDEITVQTVHAALEPWGLLPVDLPIVPRFDRIFHVARKAPGLRP